MIEQHKNGFWTITEDQWISKWSRESGQLDHDAWLLPKVLKYIKEGDTVLDIGAFIGDHTVAYLRQVGGSGKVIAFEPQQEAYMCLIKNCERAICHNFGLSDKEETLKVNSGPNKGASFLSSEGEYEVKLFALDDILPNFHVDFIKADQEGGEVKMLKGAKNLINQFKPTMLIEVNAGMLEKQGSTKGQLFDLLLNYGYDFSIVQDDCFLASPQYDLLCFHSSKRGSYAVH